jgi:3-hexulose-6-phosphate synthase
LIVLREELLNKLRMGKHLQVALDLIDLSEAMEIGLKACRGGADIIEAGTPLVKAEGLKGVRELKKSIGNKPLLVDMKTADVGDLEVFIASKAGGNITTVLGIMNDSTISSAYSEAIRRDILLEADLIGSKDPVKRAKELDGKVDIIGFHIGIDMQRTLNMSASDLVELANEIAEVFSGPVSIAGGIRAENINSLRNCKASIIVVGSGITSSKDPEGETRKIKEYLTKI